MDDLLDMMIADESPSQISDAIKDVLYAKSAERVDAFRPMVANAAFGGEGIEAGHALSRFHFTVCDLSGSVCDSLCVMG